MNSLFSGFPDRSNKESHSPQKTTKKTQKAQIVFSVSFLWFLLVNLLSLSASLIFTLFTGTRNRFRTLLRTFPLFCDLSTGFAAASLRGRHTGLLLRGCIIFSKTIKFNNDIPLQLPNDPFSL
jgi:hypothetical protein